MLWVRRLPKKWLGTVAARDIDAAIGEAVWRFDAKDPSKPIAVQRP